MADQTKQVYIPAIIVKGSYIEEIGGTQDKIVYPGKKFDLTISAEDFESIEDYHTTWINITRAVKAKIKKDHELHTSS
jgi:hypothetical protein